MLLFTRKSNKQNVQLFFGIPDSVVARNQLFNLLRCPYSFNTLAAT